MRFRLIDAAKKEFPVQGVSGDLCIWPPAHAVFRYRQASKRPANIMAS